MIDVRPFKWPESLAQRITNQNIRKISQRGRIKSIDWDLAGFSFVDYCLLRLLKMALLNRGFVENFRTVLVPYDGDGLCFWSHGSAQVSEVSSSWAGVKVCEIIPGHWLAQYDLEFWMLTRVCSWFCLSDYLMYNKHNVDRRCAWLSASMLGIFITVMMNSSWQQFRIIKKSVTKVGQLVLSLTSSLHVDLCPDCQVLHFSNLLFIIAMANSRYRWLDIGWGCNLELYSLQWSFQSAGRVRFNHFWFLFSRKGEKYLLLGNQSVGGRNNQFPTGCLIQTFPGYVLINLTLSVTYTSWKFLKLVCTTG